MKKLEIESGSEENNKIIRAGGVKRIHGGWYTVWYNGVMLDSSVTVKARRNKGGALK